MSWGATVDRTVAQGFRVLAAIASGAQEIDALAGRLRLSHDTTARHIESLIRADLVRRDGDRLDLSERATLLLDRLVGRVDLFAIAGPLVGESELLLGIGIDIEVPEAADPRSVRGSAPFAVVMDRHQRPSLVTSVVDAAGQIACVLRLAVDGLAPEAIEALGGELAALADRISARLPRRKDRKPERRDPPVI